MGNVRKPIIENPVYCKILIDLSNKKKSVSDLVETYKGESKLRGTKTKSQPALREQLLELKKQGYVGLLEEQEKGKKFDKNRKFFYIIWAKIVEDYINFILNQYKKEISNDKEYKEYQKERNKEIIKNKDKWKRNFFVQQSFKFLFDDDRRAERRGIILDVFSDTINYEVFSKIKDKFLEMLKLTEIEFKDKTIFWNKALPETIGKEKAKEYDDFISFIGYIPEKSKISHYDFVETYVASNIVKSIVGEKQHNKIVLERMKKFEEQKYEEAEYPKKEIDIKEIKEAINKIERIRKETELVKDDRKLKLKDKEQIRKWLIELKTKFYFIDTGLRFIPIEEIRKTPFDYYIFRDLLNLELGLIREHYIEGVDVKKLWEDVKFLFGNST